MKQYLAKLIVCIALLGGAMHGMTQPLNKLYGGTGVDKYTAIVNLPKGGYAAVGTTNSSGMTKGGSDILVTKYSSSGKVVWSKSFGSSGTEEGISVTLNRDSTKLVVLANYQAPNTSNRDVLVLSLDTLSGNINMYKVFRTPINGTKTDERAKSIKLCTGTNSGYIIYGDKWPSSSNTTDGDYFLLKLTEADFAFDWAKEYSTSGGGEIAGDIIPVSDGYWLFGASHYGNYDKTIIKLKTNGDLDPNFINSRYGTGNDDGFSGAVQVSDGGFVVFGHVRNESSGNMSIFKFGTDRVLQWMKSYKLGGGVDFQERGWKGVVKQSAQGDTIAIVGYKLDLSDATKKDILLIRTKLNGDLLDSPNNQAIIYSSPREDEAFGIVSLPNGYALAGYSNVGDGTADANLIHTNTSGSAPTNCSNEVVVTDLTNAVSSQSCTTTTVNLIMEEIVSITGFGIISFEIGMFDGSDCSNNCLKTANFTGLSEFYCPGAPSVTLTGNYASGVFSGPGVSGNVFSPSNVTTPGEVTITYTVSSLVSPCSTSVSKKTLIVQSPKYIDRIISASASTFSDAWPIDATGSPVQSTLKTMDEVSSGTKGIWRMEESHVYVDERQRTNPSVNLKNDGIFNDMPLFYHNSALNGGCNPSWRKVNTMTAYNTNSNETENRDILNIHTAALYGHKGDLASAVAANAKDDEVAFESFEEYFSSYPVKPDSIGNGNFSFFNTTVTSADFSNGIDYEWEVSVATDNVMTVSFPSNRKTELQGKTLKITGSRLNIYNQKDIYGSYVVSSVEGHPSDPSKTIVSLTSFPYAGIWKGKAVVSSSLGFMASRTSGVAGVSTAKAHTGKQCMLVNSNATFPQHRLKLQSGKKYVFSVWLSVSTIDVSSFYLCNQSACRGVTLSFFDGLGNPVAYTQTIMTPKGNVIEGWQRIQEEFTVPAGAQYMAITFSPGSGATYWDDVRIFPFDGNMKSYVYNRINYKVSAILDENNYASYYYYDEQGSLFLVKKETEKGVMTVQESFFHGKQTN